MPPQSKLESIKKVVENPFYQLVLHGVISYALSTVHNPDSKGYLQEALQPLKDALDQLYAPAPAA